MLFQFSDTQYEAYAERRAKDVQDGFRPGAVPTGDQHLVRFVDSGDQGAQRER